MQRQDPTVSKERPDLCKYFEIDVQLFFLLLGIGPFALSSYDL